MKGIWRKIQILYHLLVLSETSKALYLQQKYKRPHHNIFVLIVRALDMGFGMSLAVTINNIIFFPNSISSFLSLEAPRDGQVLGIMILATAAYLLLRMLLSRLFALSTQTDMELLQLQNETQAKLKALTDA